MSKRSPQSVIEKLKFSPLPVFFLQLGNHVSLFFDRVIEQAELTNGAGNVFILADCNLGLYASHNCIDISNYVNRERSFDALYTHHSTNSVFFEKACFDRWFIINELISDHGIARFVYADCDVLLLEDLKPVFAQFIRERYDGTIMYLENGDNSISSAHTSFWNQKLLTDFCSFINAGYADEKWFSNLVKAVKSGKFYGNTNVSDMIFLDAFRTTGKPNTLNLLSLEKEDISFDFNITAAFNGCEDTFGLTKLTKLKKIIKSGGKMMGEVSNGKSVKYRHFYSLHFQGYLTKALIPLYSSPQTTHHQLTGWWEYVKRRTQIAKNKLRATVSKYFKR